MTKYYKRARDVDAEPSISYVHWLTMDPDGTHPDGGNLTDEVVVDIHPTADFPNWILESNNFVWYSAVDETTYLVKATQPVFTNQNLTSATGWSKSASITISGGFAAFNGAGEQNLYQAIGIAGNRYASDFTISSYSSGGLRPFMGSGNPLDPQETANGTYSSKSLTSTDTLLGWNTRGDTGGVLSLSWISFSNLSRTRWNPLYGGSGSIGGYISNATAAQQPWYGSSDGYDGLILFDAGDYIISSLPLSSWKFLNQPNTPASCFAVLSHIQNGAGQNVGPWVILTTANATSGIGISCYLDTDNKYELRVRNGVSAEVELFKADKAITIDKLHIIEIHKDINDNISMLLNGEIVVSGTCTAFINANPDQVTGSLVTGRAGTAGNTPRHLMGDLLIYNGLLTEDEKEGIRNRLMTSHGINYESF